MTAADKRGSPRTRRLARYLDARRRLSPRASVRAFEELVGEALDALPEFVRQRLDNVAVVVEEWPDRERVVALGHDPELGLLGLYEGIPHHQRGSSYHLVAPDRITLYRQPILAQVGTAGRPAIREEVRKTVIHEVAHHFGIGDEELARLEGEEGPPSAG